MNWGAVTSVGKPGKAGVGMREWGDDFNFGLAELEEKHQKNRQWGKKNVCSGNTGGPEWQYQKTENIPGNTHWSCIVKCSGQENSLLLWWVDHCGSNPQHRLTVEIQIQGRAWEGCDILNEFFSKWSSRVPGGTTPGIDLWQRESRPNSVLLLLPSCLEHTLIFGPHQLLY